MVPWHGETKKQHDQEATSSNDADKARGVPVGKVLHMIVSQEDAHHHQDAPSEVTPSRARAPAAPGSDQRAPLNGEVLQRILVPMCPLIHAGTSLP